MGLRTYHNAFRDFNRILLERRSKGCDRHVGKKVKEQDMIQSTTRHEKSGGKQGGPSPKAKYYLVTDSEEYREGKVKRTPGGE
jgi:hypothetical protein